MTQQSELDGLPEYLLRWIVRTRGHDPVVALDARWRLVLATPEFERLVGMPCGPLIGSMPPFAWWGDLPRSLEQMRFLVSPRSAELGVRAMQGTVRRGDGSEVPARGEYEQVRVGDEVIFHVSTYALEIEPEPVRSRLRGLEAVFRRLSAVLAEAGAEAGLALRRVGQGLDLARLTPREHDVLDALLAGQRAPEIAVDLGLSRYTARNHVRSIYAKLGVHSQIELLQRVGLRA